MSKKGWKKFKSEEVRAHVKKKKKAAKLRKYRKSKKGKEAKKKELQKRKEFRKRRAKWWKNDPPFHAPYAPFPG